MEDTDDNINVTLISDFSEDQQNKLLGETIGCAVLDSGCTSTVCGEVWLRTFVDTIADNEKKLVTERPTSKMFRFGDGQTYKSIKTATIPIHTGTQKALLEIEVVKCNIPLLLSNNSLKKANANLDFGSEQINFMGEEIPIKISKSGHYYIKLSREPTTQTTDIKRIFFTSPINPEELEDSRNKIKKLHKQFAHPHPKR